MMIIMMMTRALARLWGPLWSAWMRGGMEAETLMVLRRGRLLLVRFGYVYSLGYATSMLLPGDKTSRVGAGVLLGLGSAAGVLWLIDAAVMDRADRRIAARNRAQVPGPL